MLKIYLTRHGQNEDNVEGILNGHRDRPLTDIGVAQAKTTARYVQEAKLQFDKVYSSPLIRAHTTAEIIAQELALPAPEVLDNLIERDFGIMSGKLASQITELCSPDIIQTDTITYFLAPEGAETFPDLIVRAKAVLSYLHGQHTTGSILLVTHGDIGKMLYAAYYNLAWEDVLRHFHFGNCEVLVLAEDSPASAAHVFTQQQHNQ